MSYTDYLLAAFFLPLFPFSMVLNALYGRVHQPLLRIAILVLWPQFGLYLVFSQGLVVSETIMVWALLTSLLYALRVLVLREMGLWTSFVATSSWALLWILLMNGSSQQDLQVYALGISVPLALLAVLGAGLERRYGAAYLGLYGGLASNLPRFAGILSMVVLAVVATPLFPTFFAMLSMILKSMPVTPLVAIGVGIVWLLWSWAGAKLLQGLLVGAANDEPVADLSRINMWLFILVLAGLIVASVYWLGVMA